MNDQLVLIGDPAVAPTSAAYGRKATALHVLTTHDLPVPKAFALSFSLAEQIEAGEVDAIRSLLQATEALAFPIAVRSSANLEDLKDGAAPGLFHSVLGVASHEDVLVAIAKVLGSGRTPLVRAYLQARGIKEAPRVALILQEQIKSSCFGVVYSRPPGQPDSGLAILETPGCHPIWIDRETGDVQLPDASPLERQQVNALWALTRAAEDALATTAGIDLEWVWDGRGPWVVQARAVVHRQELTSFHSQAVRELLAFSRADRNRLWRLDATHNPFPLSSAQAGLVSEVAALAPYDMRVVGGYLYTAKRPSLSAAPRSLARHELKRLFIEELLPKMEASLSVVEKQEAPSLGDALKAYREVFRCYTDELGPALASLDGSDEGTNPLSVWLARARQGSISLDNLMTVVAPIAPAWDVSVPTYGETPALVQRALSQRSTPLNDCGDGDGDGDGDGTDSITHTMEESLSETDDLLFYRAQYLVRRALLALAKRWHVGNDIFFMPLATLRVSQDSPHVPPGLVDKARHAEEAWQAQRAVEMPLTFINGEPVPSRLPPDSEIWRGLGTGGFVTGRVLRVANLHDFPSLDAEDNCVLVMPTVTPAHALAARGAVAVICEYGEHLGHGAAMARELNIPCIVGCRRAWRELRNGELVAVHGQAGLVARLATEPPSISASDKAKRRQNLQPPTTKQ